MLAGKWYYRLDGEVRGPFNIAQFEKLIRTRTVTSDTEVSNDGQTWQTLRTAMEGLSADPIDWMNAPTLMPGQVPRPDRKSDPPA